MPRPEADSSVPQRVAKPFLVLRSFDEIRDHEIRLVAGYQVDGKCIPLHKRNEIFAAYLRDAIAKEIAAIEDELLLAKCFMMAARTELKVRGSWLKAVFSNAVAKIRTPTFTGTDADRAKELIASKPAGIPPPDEPPY